MSEAMIIGIVLFGVGVLVFIGGAMLRDCEGEAYIIFSVFICVIAFVIMLCCLVEDKEPKPTETIYPLTVKVETVNHEADVVSCVDGTGNVWEFFGCEDWQEGDFASLLMNDKGTPSIYDDEIITARYAGIFGD